MEDNFEYIRRALEEAGLAGGDWVYSEELFPGGRMERMTLKIPTKDIPKPIEKPQDFLNKYVQLPPLERFEMEMKLLVDMGDATPAEKAAVTRLLKKLRKKYAQGHPSGKTV